MAGCTAAGEYRAPKSRETLNQYWWFCLEHVRAYNSKWDFYKGMSPGQIEAQLRADTAWQRPTWPLGRLGNHATIEEALLNDPLASLGRMGAGQASRASTGVPQDLREPLATLGLGWPVTMEDLKTRYKELAKRHHPDANGGDRRAEERLKSINIAYAAVRGRISAQPRMAAAG